MIIIGTRVFFWGSTPASYESRCGQCGLMAPFILKKGMRFITVFFIIPIIPISGMMETLQCPKCGTRYEPGA